MIKLKIIFNYFLLVIIGLLTSSCTQTKDINRHSEKNNQHTFTNQLINESSPYLLQHAHNPVNWYPWGEEALAKAKKENKPIIISIGYAACHWCHVMEKESFEDETVAELMNNNFISIKIDREERPDIDQVYIEAAQMMNNGRAGWPLNCITLPDTKPFFAGTYFPKEQWINLLYQIIEAYNTKKDLLEQDAENITNGIKVNRFANYNAKIKKFELKTLRESYSNWKQRFDTKEGGYLNPPKFPIPQSIKTLLSYYSLSKEKSALDQVTLTLDKMAAGGIYDQIGGGFARYSTDKVWKVPHFEKMLYDNGQLVTLYSLAYQETKNERYREVVYQTLEFIERELYNGDGGFYSSLDADSDGKEGKFYVWSKKEIEDIIKKDASLFIEYFNIKEHGNWEEQNILYNTKPKNLLAKKYGIDEVTLTKKIKNASAKLLEARANRVRPGLDDKILTAWNSMMIKAYIDAYRVFNDKHFLEMAISGANFILEKVKQSDNRLNRNYKDGKSSINGFLDDYAFTINAFISLYQATFDETWLQKAHNLLKYANDHFKDESSPYYFYTSDIDPDLIARKVDVTDNVIPSANSVMAKNLFYLGKYFYNEKYNTQAIKMLSGIQDYIVQSGSFFSNWYELQLHQVYPFYEIAIVGNDSEKLRFEMDKVYKPNAIFLGGKNEGKLELLEDKLVEGETTIYVCIDKACKLPVTTSSKALKLME